MNSEVGLKILVADHQTLFRQGVVNALTKRRGFSVVAEAQDGLEAIANARAFKPDVIVMDTNLPGPSPREVCRQLLADLPGASILLFATSDEAIDLCAALEAGAMGAVLRDSSPEQLVQAIEAATRGEKVVSGPLVRKLRTQLSAQRAEDSGLTQREGEILELVALEISNQDVATSLFISQNTVKTHVKNILEKLQLKNRAQAAAYAARHGWTKGRLKPL